MIEVYVLPELSQVILQLTVTLLMLIVVRKFFWGPITEFVKKKEDISIAEVNEAKRQNIEAEKLLEEANQTVKSAREKAADIVNESKNSANAVHDRIINDAKKEVDYLKANAKDSIDQEKNRFYNDLKNQVADLAMEAASKIVNKELDASKHEEIIDSVIEGVS